MRLSTLCLSAACLLAASACTADQDLGNHPDSGSIPGGDGDSPSDSGDNVGPAKDGSSNNGDGDTSIDPPVGDGDSNSFEIGKAEPLSVVTAGTLSFSNNEQEFGVSLTTMSGTDGCAMVGSQEAAPGTVAARVLVHVAQTGTGDHYCPDGIYAIKNDFNDCSLSWGARNGLPPGCAVYERWNAQGDVEARVLGVGGSISVTSMEDTTVGTGHTYCHVEVTARFPGQAVSDTFDYDYYPQLEKNAFCVQ